MKELYSIYRDYMKHEDDLINHRSTWHLLIQGFLFATFGVMGEWQPGDVTGFLLPQRLHLAILLASIGTAIAILAFASVFAAYFAIERLCKDWNHAKVDSGISQALRGVMPGIAGAGSTSVKNWGISAAMVTPLLIAGAWTLILCVAISSTHGAAAPGASPQPRCCVTCPPCNQPPRQPAAGRRAIRLRMARR